MKQAASNIAFPSAVTSSAAFGCVAPGEHLFQVVAGVDTKDALQLASCYFDVAGNLTRAIGSMSTDTGLGGDLDFRDLAWAACYLIEFGKAVVDSYPIVSKAAA